jgi:Type I restriction modification DNA specificity domain
LNSQSIAGHVDYLDDEHKIQGNCLAVGMLGMQFFYMKSDFYAGQFTKRAIPKTFELNENIAKYLTTILNKNQRTFQSCLVRDFEHMFKKTKIKLPVRNGMIDYDFMEQFITEIKAVTIDYLSNFLSPL